MGDAQHPAGSASSSRSRATSTALLYLIGVGGEILLLTAIYLVMPVGRLSFRHALIGGITAGLLWEVTRHLLVLYYETMSQIQVVYGSLTTAIVALLSVEIGAIVLLLGAQVISEYERDRLRADRRAAEAVEDRSAEGLNASLERHRAATPDGVQPDEGFRWGAEAGSLAASFAGAAPSFLARDGGTRARQPRVATTSIRDGSIASCTDPCVRLLRRCRSDRVLRVAVAAEAERSRRRRWRRRRGGEHPDLHGDCVAS